MNKDKMLKEIRTGYLFCLSKLDTKKIHKYMVKHDWKILLSDNTMRIPSIEELYTYIAEYCESHIIDIERTFPHERLSSSAGFHLSYIPDYSVNISFRKTCVEYDDTEWDKVLTGVTYYFPESDE